MWTSVSAAVAQGKKLDTIANNLANVDTTGFKKDEIVFREYLTVLEKPENQEIDIPRKEFELKDFYHHHGNDKSFVNVKGTFTNFDQGSLKPTGGALDVALDGPGFMEVLTPRGVRYTRQGDLKMAPDGTLVTTSGYAVLSQVSPEVFQDPEGELTKDQGLIEAFSPENRKIFLSPSQKLSIGPTGLLSQGGKNMAQISLVEFKNPGFLRKEGHGLLANPDEKNVSIDLSKTLVRQGYLEGSNVNPLKEMTEMIKTNRLFENTQRAIRQYDQIENGVMDLGKVY